MVVYLYKWKSLFGWLPIETLIRERQDMELLELKHRPTFRDNYLLPALELGLIEMTVPDKPHSSKQKYKKVKDIGS